MSASAMPREQFAKTARHRSSLRGSAPSVAPRSWVLARAGGRRSGEEVLTGPPVALYLKPGLLSMILKIFPRFNSSVTVLKSRTDVVSKYSIRSKAQWVTATALC
jgi:hypothetical protein